MTDMEERLLALVEGNEERLPLLTLGEARAAMELLRLLSLGDGEGSDVAYELAGKLARRLPAEEEQE